MAAVANLLVAVGEESVGCRSVGLLIGYFGADGLPLEALARSLDPLHPESMRLRDTGKPAEVGEVICP